MLSWKSGAVAGACLVLGFAHAAAADVYTWRTEDGGYAYTDDRDQIPARYRAQAKRVGSTSLRDYERYTPQDPEATSRYAERLERRLAVLREVNATPAPARDEAPATSSGSLLISTGDGNAPALSLPMQANGGEPMVIEEVTSKRTGDARTRRSTVVRQGGRVVTVILGEPHIHDPNGFVDEEALEAGELD
jgi:hypothetical protein